MGFLRSKFFLVITIAAIVGSTVTNVSAQTLTGQIGGTVVDSQKGVIPGATVSVRNTSTQVARETRSLTANGVFVITNLIAGTYDVKVTLTGFKTYEQKGLVLTATERLSLPADHARGRRLLGSRVGRGLQRPRPDPERRTIGDDHRVGD